MSNGIKLATPEFEVVKAEIILIMDEVRSKFEAGYGRIAKLLGDMSTVDLDNMCDVLAQRYGMRRTFVRKLAAFGQGKMPAYLAFNSEINISPTYWLNLPESARKVFASPTSEISLRTEKGLIIKQAKDLNYMELLRVTDRKQGIVPPEKQKLPSDIYPEKIKHAEDIPEMESVHPAPNGRDVIITFKNGQKGICPIKTLRMYIK